MIQQYINSGILEAYVTGSASPQEVEELMYMRVKYPEVNTALNELETDMELFARHMAVPPPEHIWNKISDNIEEIILRDRNFPQQFKEREDNKYSNFSKPDTGPDYIEVEAQSNHMKVHKAWRWVFAAVFILGKIFLAFAIYFYLENRQAQQQIKELKTEMQRLKR
ncbi:hypothetical protein ACFQZX_06625 [Mucilaginibacter litoreus]|uniref:Uncharacterized protein n=1 Tax=Mucilaginibacter litoreus TaxID=1048221 RepID=A0ABW3AQE4_9SPHI